MHAGQAMELKRFFFFPTASSLAAGKGSVAVIAGDDDRDHDTGVFMFDDGREREYACVMVLV